jgi:hypothetical protein
MPSKFVDTPPNQIKHYSEDLQAIDPIKNVTLERRNNQPWPMMDVNCPKNG